MKTRLIQEPFNRPVTVVMLFIATLFVGAIAAWRVPIELFPSGYEAQSLQVIVPWPDTSPQEVMREITLPLEEELSTIKGLEGMNSWSGSGGASVFLRFKSSTDIDVAYREARNRIERAKLLLPDDVRHVQIRKEDISGIPVFVIGAIIHLEGHDYGDLLQDHIVEPLSRVDGVASVDVDGMEEKEILIELNKALTDSYGLNIFDLAEQLDDDNFTMSSGTVSAGNKEFLLRSVAEFESLDELENRPVTPSVRLGDIAEIRYEPPDRQYRVRVNGEPAAAIVVLKEGEANTLELSRKLEAVLEKIREDPRIRYIELETLFSQGEVIQESLKTLAKSGQIGGLFATVILFLFLRRVRLTLIITLSIPLSVVIALIVLFFSGETLNILTILGLVICIGLLVDNSVVVAENIFRHHAEGTPTRSAAISGTAEMALPIVTATLTTVIVFLPAALVEGQAQFFLVRLALPICVALLGSLGVSLVFIPLCVSYTLMRRSHRSQSVSAAGAAPRKHRRRDRFFHWLDDHTLVPTRRAVLGTLDFFLARRLDLILLTTGLFAASFWLSFRQIEFVPVHQEARNSFRISVQFPNEYSFAEVQRYFDDAERLLADSKEESGMDGYFVFFQQNQGRIEGWFDPDRSRSTPTKQVAETLMDRLPPKPGVEVFYGEENRMQEETEEDVYPFHLQGRDLSRLQSAKNELQEVVRHVDGVLGIKQGEQARPNQLGVLVDQERAAATGANPRWIAGVVGYALRGATLPRFNAQGREIPVRIRFREEDRETLTDLRDFQVPTREGNLVSLASVTSSTILSSPRGVFRRDRRITETITLKIKEQGQEAAHRRLNAIKAGWDLPEGISFGEDQSAWNAEDWRGLSYAAMLSIVFVYLLMGLLFESVVLPMSIILTIPLASLGVSWIHSLLGKDIDFLGAVGSILLIGVVVNNGIVFIDYVHQLRKAGLDRNEALKLAVERRFRPILMTALTTICGMIPLALSKPTDIGMSYQSFGLTLIGGMSTATLLTLIVVPVIYTLLDDTRQLLGVSP